ncbi:hypothetical protein [Nocardia sp. NPDC051570]|uniref:hypothetical protein n=1 Tax=Nocardia sp. NPDC051570 TaxID=3364324 RepID=UPI0037B499DD
MNVARQSDPRRAEYEKALAELRAATDQWNHTGEPREGPVLDRLNAARDRFITAQTPHEDAHTYMEKPE